MPLTPLYMAILFRGLVQSLQSIVAGLICDCMMEFSIKLLNRSISIAKRIVQNMNDKTGITLNSV